MAMSIMNETKTTSLYTTVALILTQILLLIHFKTTKSAKSTLALPGCPESCGGITIPYPFGIGPNCSLSEEFDIHCNELYIDGMPSPYFNAPISIEINTNWIPYEILNISLSLGQAQVSSRIFYQCYDSKTKTENHSTVDLQIPDFSFGDRPFWLNTEKNKFTVIGCNTLAYLRLDATTNYSVGCLSSCDSLHTIMKYGSCTGIGCCQTAISRETNWFNVDFDGRYDNSAVYNFSPCSYAMVVEEAEFNFNTTYITTDVLNYSNATVPMVINWAIGNMPCGIAQTNKSSYACRSDHSVCLNSTSGHGGYLCNCSHGYQGNPYLDGDCQDIDECATQNPCSKPAKCHNFEGGYRCSCPFGWHSNRNKPGAGECDFNVTLVVGMTIMLGFATAVSIILLSFIIAKRIKLFEKRKQERLKQKFFIQNRGLLLQQLIASHEDTTQKMINFGLHELEKATNSFDNALILGRGGHGEVYKGILSDQRVVAIKKSKIVDQAEIDQFINEVVILSQVNHRNVVKLYGCCLETEVPLLVYEFISNGTLFNHLHVEEQCSLTWKHRLRIALEAARAISYLHSSASISVFHRDIKSSNILLDDYFTAKVSDFGASRSVKIDQTGVTTNIQGTHGYLDPEYYYTYRLTPKSDVYSFGVILAELLTREKPLISSRVYEGGSLIAYFRSAMRENRLFEILDPQVVKEGHRIELEAVAKLAEICLRMEGDERPSMKEVEIRLEVLWRSNQHQIHPWRSQSLEERQLMLLDYNRRIDTETLLSEQSFHDNGIGHTCNYFNIDKEAEESIAIGR